MFDGIKDAFSAEDADMAIDQDRETPFDRWMGISTKATAERKKSMSAFVDSMADENYMKAALKKPMGVVFEENDPSSGGVFVASLAADGAAQTEGTLKAGDQLVAVNGSPVLGLSFDDSLEKIIESDIDPTELIVFRGGVTNLYGNLGPADDWLKEFLEKNTPAALKAKAAPAAASEEAAAAPEAATVE